MSTLRKKYKIFDYAWHIPHQYDMANALKEDCHFFFCLNAKKQWDTAQRPVPDNIQFVTHYEQGKYDAALLHIDQEVIITDHIKTLIFHQFDQIITDIPKIIINHGTPVFPERFHELGMYNISHKEMEQECIKVIKAMVGKRPMVVNSFASANEKEWGFGIPIVHGMNAADWYDAPFKEPRVFTALSPYGFDTYYNRQRMFDVSERLFETYGYTLAYARLNIDTDTSHQAYKTYLGSSLLYLDTSVRTPMNRARTEAFLSGCCVIQVEGAHDLERWAKHGENIILVPDDTDIIAHTVADLIENRYKEALEIGQQGKKMAIEWFNPERYRNDWLTLLNQVVNIS